MLCRAQGAECDVAFERYPVGRLTARSRAATRISRAAMA